MAEIKVERKSGSSWIWWLLGLVVLAAIVWWLLAANTRRADTTAATGAMPATDVAGAPVAGAPVAGAPVAGAPVAGAPVAGAMGDSNAVTTLAMLTGANAASMAGRPVAIASAPVQAVVSDRGFWVGDAGQRVFVVRTSQASPATPPDGAVNAGQTVSVWGTVQQMPADLTQRSAEWNLRSTDRNALANQPIYVQADSVHIGAR